VDDDTPLAAVSSMKNSAGMTGVTNPVGAQPSSTSVQGQAAAETSLSASA
jgi:hypothetical protein